MNTKFKFLMAATALVVGFSSCSNDDDENVGPNSGQQTTMKISIPMVKTYAEPKDTIASESAFSTVDVYIFNGNSFETHKSLTKSDFTLTGTTWTLNDVSSISTTTGAKNIYVGLNLPEATKTAIKSGVYSVVTPSIADLSTANAFPMFSVNNTNNIQHTVGSVAADNHFQIAVERWAAKVTARKATTINEDVPAANALITDLSFSLGNVNTKMHPLQKLLPSGIIEDPNWDGFDIGAGGTYTSSDFTNEFGSNATISHNAYKPLDAEGTALSSRVTKYAMENTSKAHYQGEVTYISVRGKFQPKAYYTYTNGTLTVVTSPTSVPSELYVVKAPEGVLFFELQAEAAAYATEKLGADPTKVVLVYKDGYTYFNIWLDAKVAGNVHPTLRNRIFDALITDIKSLGNPNPEPINPYIPTPTATELTVEVSIEPWSLVSTEHSLED